MLLHEGTTGKLYEGTGDSMDRQVTAVTVRWYKKVSLGTGTCMKVRVSARRYSCQHVSPVKETLSQVVDHLWVAHFDDLCKQVESFMVFPRLHPLEDVIITTGMVIRRHYSHLRSHTSKRCNTLYLKLSCCTGFIYLCEMVK